MSGLQEARGELAEILREAGYDYTRIPEEAREHVERLERIGGVQVLRPGQRFLVKWGVPDQATAERFA